MHMPKSANLLKPLHKKPLKAHLRPPPKSPMSQYRAQGAPSAHHNYPLPTKPTLPIHALPAKAQAAPRLNAPIACCPYGRASRKLSPIEHHQILSGSIFYKKPIALIKDLTEGTNLNQLPFNIQWRAWKNELYALRSTNRISWAYLRKSQ